MSKAVLKVCFKDCKFILILIILSCIHFTAIGQLKIGGNSKQISGSSILELESTKKGLLLPRLSDTLSINVLNPPDGTIIYLKTVNAVTSGLYVRRNGFWQILGPADGQSVIADMVLNPDSTVSVLYNDGSILKTQLRITGGINQGSSGLPGPPGNNGRGIQNIILNKDSTLSFLFSDNSITTLPEKIIGRNGINGTGVTGARINSDSTLSLLYSDNSSFTSSERIIGRNGEKGKNGIGIANVLINADSTISLVFSDSSLYTSTERIIGRDGRSIQQIIINSDSTISFRFSDSTDFKSAMRVIGRDGIGILWKGSLGSSPDSALLNWAYYDTVLRKSFIYDGASWAILAQDGVGSNSGTFNGNRPITASVFNGQNPGTNDIGKWLENLFYPSQGPVSGLSLTYGGSTSSSFSFEQMAAGANLNATLNWSGGRQASTAPLATIVVAGSAQTFSQPSQGVSVSGTKSVSFARNTNSSFSNLVTTTDNKSASSSVSISFSWKRYFGFLPGTADGVAFYPSDPELISLTQSFGSSRNFSASVTPSGAQRLVIAYPNAWEGSNTQILINGLDQTGAFFKSVRSFTNSSGGSTMYVIYVSTYNTSGSVNISLQ